MKRDLAASVRSLAALACVLVLVSACATGAKNQVGIEARAMERWDKLLSGDLAGAYEFLSPGYRTSVSSTEYQRSILLKRLKWTEAKFIESNCEEFTCNVTISINFVVYGALPGVKSFEDSQEIIEPWIKDAGEWYYVPPQ